MGSGNLASVHRFHRPPSHRSASSASYSSLARAPSAPRPSPFPGERYTCTGPAGRQLVPPGCGRPWPCGATAAAAPSWALSLTPVIDLRCALPITSRRGIPPTQPTPNSRRTRSPCCDEKTRTHSTSAAGGPRVHGHRYGSGRTRVHGRRIGVARRHSPGRVSTVDVPPAARRRACPSVQLGYKGRRSRPLAGPSAWPITSVFFSPAALALFPDFTTGVAPFYVVP